MVSLLDNEEEYIDPLPKIVLPMSLYKLFSICFPSIIIIVLTDTFRISLHRATKKYAMFIYSHPREITLFFNSRMCTTFS